MGLKGTLGLFFCKEIKTVVNLFNILKIFKFFILIFEFCILHFELAKPELAAALRFATPIQEGPLVACTKLRRKTPFAQRMFLFLSRCLVQARPGDKKQKPPIFRLKVLHSTLSG